MSGIKTVRGFDSLEMQGRFYANHICTKKNGNHCRFFIWHFTQIIKNKNKANFGGFLFNFSNLQIKVGVFGYKV